MLHNTLKNKNISKETILCKDIFCQRHDSEIKYMYTYGTMLFICNGKIYPSLLQRLSERICKCNKKVLAGW